LNTKGIANCTDLVNENMRYTNESIVALQAPKEHTRRAKEKRGVLTSTLLPTDLVTNQALLPSLSCAHLLRLLICHPRRHPYCRQPARLRADDIALTSLAMRNPVI
jgi:hypothetical protein